MQFTFIDSNHTGFLIYISGAATARCGANVPTLNGDVKCWDTRGNSLTLKAVNSTNWFATSVIGTWTWE